jgi:hypothetical protein
MIQSRTQRPLLAGLTVGLALVISAVCPSRAFAQPLSTGSGSGTGTGQSGGAARNSTGTGQEAGAPRPSGLPSDNLMIPYRQRGADGRIRDVPRAPHGTSIPLGPGVGTSIPGDSARLPLSAILESGLPGTAADFKTVTEQHLNYALQIPAPGERSLSLSRIASAATFSNQLDLADQAVAAAAAAALEIGPGMVRDQRLISTVTAMLNLAESRLREGTTTVVLPETPDNSPSSAPRLDRNQLIRKAIVDWRRAADLAHKVDNPTYRNELIFHIADSMGVGSQTIIAEYPRIEPDDTSKGGSGLDVSYEGLPDWILKDAAALATTIDRPVWHDRTLVTIATSAAESRQFLRALTVARMIPQPEVRTDALLKIAEKQARRDDPTGATATYKEAALAVASIPLDDPRDVLTGVLVDNLISVGRFEDARASVNLYTNAPLKMIALGAIAESQGRRGAAAEALAWINREIAPPYRSQLYRRVSNGVVSAIEQNRSRDQSK